jgi:NADH:ubiquinone oxidoreductase subunit F (NADH-binding)
MVLANLLNADSVIICVAREHLKTITQVKAAIAQRGAKRLQGPSFEVQSPPGRYVAGEESALVHWLNSNETLPQYRPTRPSIQQIGRGGVLLDNAETQANIGLIARHGAEWFRSVGTATRPGTTVTSVTGNGKAVVLEVPYGTAIRSILSGAGLHYEPRALLLGGYGGTWLDGKHLDVGFDDDSLRPFGAGTGAGVIMALPPESCGVAECARIVDYMAKESARQCGPCAFGLPAMAEDLKALASGRNASHSLSRLTSRSNVIEGRGACRHPDGVIRLVRTALNVFAEDFSHHAAGQPCQFAHSARVSYIPHQSDVKDLEWE